MDYEVSDSSGEPVNPLRLMLCSMKMPCLFFFNGKFR